MKLHFSLSFFFSFLGLSAFGQARLTGSVRDGGGQPLPHASVLLLQARDSSLVKSAVADAQGRYAFESARAGCYRLSASLVGYAPVYAGPVEVGESATTTLPPLTLAETAGQLAAVQVTAKKPFVEQRLDRMVVNVAGSIVGSGSTALEVLEKSPGVTVDYQNERLQLRGKDGVIVLVDGRQSYLSAADLIALLRTMSSDQIETIELITNPPARYDAAGNSGLINIRLKKNSALGTNGALSLAGGSGQFDRERGGLNLNHRTQTWNAFGSYSVNRGGNYWDFYKTIDQPDPAPTDPARRNFVINTTHLTFRDLGQNAKAGLDFSLNKTTTIGVVWTGVWSDHRETGPAEAFFRRSENGPVYLQTRTQKTYDKKSQNQLGNLN
ncbi:MAG: TonB-dependent receptor, partial [Sphingobacteriaceae bacterium]|nr:TonB-dependent receptor [Cytophagaceae bacterium]